MFRLPAILYVLRGNETSILNLKAILKRFCCADVAPEDHRQISSGGCAWLSEDESSCRFLVFLYAGRSPSQARGHTGRVIWRPPKI